MPVSRAFFYISFQDLSKGALPPDPPPRAPIKMLCFQGLFLPVSKIPGKGALLTGPLRSEMRVFRAFFHTSLAVPSEQGLLRRIKSHLSLKSPQ